MRPYKRRQILIENFQYRLLAANLIYFFAILLIFAAALFLPLIIHLESAALSWVEKQEPASQFLSLHTRLWPAIFVVFVLLAIHSLVVSHRIAGPLYRLRSVLKAVAKGDLSVRATIRKNDYLATEADAVNELIAALTRKITGIQDQCKEMHEMFSRLKRAIESGSVEDMKQDVADLATQMERLKVSLDQFKTAAEETRAEEGFPHRSVAASTPGESPGIARGPLPAKREGAKQGRPKAAPPGETQR